jgi:hypothetical protein
MKTVMYYGITAVMMTLATSTVSAQDMKSMQERIEVLEEQVADYNKAEALVLSNRERFKLLDLVAFNNRDWKLTKQIHHEDVTAEGGDGFVSKGMVPAHAADLEFLFNTFPDYKIHEHQISFGSGDWTAGLSRSTGTFTKAMKLRDGTVIQPNNKSFELKAITLARWDNGRIMEEYIYWDNFHLFAQLGIAELIVK